MTDPRSTEEIARSIRETHLFTVSLAAAAGNRGDLKEACDLAEQAISAALTSERERGGQAGAADAWAVAVNENIRPNTISDTRRAAIINWLVTDCGIFISNAHADHQIEAIWNAEAPKRHAEVERVSILREAKP